MCSLSYPSRIEAWILSVQDSAVTAGSRKKSGAKS